MGLPRYECSPTSPLCNDLPCKGHQVTKQVDQTARVIAWTDGWDVMEESDQLEEYWRAAMAALADIGKPVDGCRP